MISWIAAGVDRSGAHPQQTYTQTVGLSVHGAPMQYFDSVYARQTSCQTPHAAPRLWDEAQVDNMSASELDRSKSGSPTAARTDIDRSAVPFSRWKYVNSSDFAH